MTKFKTLINQLSTKDYDSIKAELKDSNADKSIFLLELVRKENPDDDTLIKKLGASPNAYYALRSRLNQRIEEFLIQQLESPRTNLFKKVLMINEILFTKPKDIAIATLKTLERELKDYDLPNELTTVYKSLKKLTLHTSNHFQYSQLYNRHIAYMLALDKAEDLLTKYFKKYGDFLLTGSESAQLELNLMKKEMTNVSALYKSHRLFVYDSCIHIFHRLFVQPDDELDDELPTEDLLKANEKILSSYKMDSIYFHINSVFDFLWFCYYDHYQVFRKVENYYNNINIRSPQLLTNFSLFTFPSTFLILKMKRALRLNQEKSLHKQNKILYNDLVVNKLDVPSYYIQTIYFSLSDYYANEYKIAAKRLSELVNEISWKKYPNALLEARILLVLFHLMDNDIEHEKLVSTSLQRQIRVIGKENCEMAYRFYLLLKTAKNDLKRNKAENVIKLARELDLIKPHHFSPLKLVKMDDSMILKLSSSVVAQV